MIRRIFLWLLDRFDAWLQRDLPQFKQVDGDSAWRRCSRCGHLVWVRATKAHAGICRA